MSGPRHIHVGSSRSSLVVLLAVLCALIPSPGRADVRIVSRATNYQEALFEITVDATWSCPGLNDIQIRWQTRRLEVCHGEVPPPFHS